MKLLFLSIIIIFLNSCALQQTTTIKPNSFTKNSETDKRVLGSLPLIVVLANDTTSKNKLHNMNFYENLYINSEENNNKNVEEYFRNVSHENFTINFQNIWGPYDLVKSLQSKSLDEKIKETFLNLYKDGFDFNRFDINNDNIITEKELLVSMIFNHHLYFGKMRFVHLFLPNGLQLQMNIATQGSDTNFATTIHEIFHLLGAVDMYGSNCYNQNLSIMSCTINSNHEPETKHVVHLDPWHKIRFGWITPRIIFTEDIKIKQCYSLEVPQYNGEYTTVHQRPLFIYDKYIKRYFIIEYRNKHISYENSISYDTHSLGFGVAIWAISVDQDNNLYHIKSLKGGYNTTGWTYNPVNNRREYLFKSFQTIIPKYSNDVKAGFSIETSKIDQNNALIEVCLQQL